MSAWNELESVNKVENFIHRVLRCIEPYLKQRHKTSRELVWYMELPSLLIEVSFA